MSALTRRELLFALAAAPGTGPRPACQTNAWRIDPGKFSEVLAVLEKIRRYGFEGFETGFRNVEGQFARASRAREEMARFGMRFLGVHIFLLEYDHATSIAPWELISRVAAGAAALGAERLILSGRGLTSGNSLDRGALDRKVAALDRTGESSSQQGLRLAYHNHDAEFAREGEEIEALLARTSMRLILDAGHVRRARSSVVDFFRRHHRRIDGIHLRDFRGDEQVPLGQGEYDLKPLAAAIREAGWGGWLIAEEERLNDVKPGDAAVAPAREGLRRLFGV